MKPVDADILLHVHPNEKFHQLLIQRKFLWSLYPLKACWGPLRAHFPFIAQGIFRSISRPKEKYMGRWSYQKTIAVLAFRPLVLEVKLFSVLSIFCISRSIIPFIYRACTFTEQWMRVALDIRRSLLIYAVYLSFGSWYLSRLSWPWKHHYGFPVTVSFIPFELKSRKVIKGTNEKANLDFVLVYVHLVTICCGCITPRKFIDSFPKSELPSFHTIWEKILLRV